MKTFFHKHRILLLAFAIVMGFGVLSGLVIGGTIRLSMRSEPFETVADAKARTENEQTGLPQPTQAPVEMPARTIARITEAIEKRRSYAIPIRTYLIINQPEGVWTWSKPDGVQTALARNQAEALSKKIFGMTYEQLTEEPSERADVWLLTDTTGYRDPVLRVTDSNGVFLLSLNAADGKLINADLLAYPTYADFDYESDVLRITRALGYDRVRFDRDIIAGAYEGREIYVYTQQDECLSIMYFGDQLSQVSVFPTQEMLVESAYFQADVQFDYSTPAYPEQFEVADPPDLKDGEMVTEDMIVRKLTRLYSTLSREELDADRLEIVFLKDLSGAREDCWQVSGEGFLIVISAYSRNVISFEGKIPCKSLLDIPFDKMGGEEYEQVTEQIAHSFLSSFSAFNGNYQNKAPKSIGVNAVHEDHYCTMDVELEDGTFYECGFADGVLTYIEYWPNERLFWGDVRPGWVANSVFLNAATQQPIIPDVPQWDGDLHVKQRPEA
jgi:hypothetical protein